MNLRFNFLTKAVLPNRTSLKAFIARIFEIENRKAGQLNFIFCSDEYLLDINQTYLKHDYYTDIITFNLSSNAQTIEGEIYISVDTVKENAIQFHTTSVHELHRVIFHGILHLLGYDDKTTKHQTQMTEKEDFYLQLYFNKG